MQSILGTTRKADITFHKGGRINISAHIAKQLDLDNGDVIDIMMERGEYYLYVKHRAPLAGRHEGMVLKSNRYGMHCVASSIKLCNAIMAECKCDKDADRLKLPIGAAVELPNIGTAIPIITRLKL
jgi:hypothetical protein